MAFNVPRRRWFYITSNTQLSSVNSTFSFEINMPDNQEFDRLVLTQALIPLSFYVIGAGQNTFILNENGVDIPVTVPPGNYSSVNFPAVIGPLLTAASQNGITYTVTYPNSATEAQTGKFTYTALNTIIPIYFTFPLDDDLAIRFGFDRGETEYFSASGPNEVLVSPNVVDFTAENSIYIHSSLVQDEAGQDILQEIYVGNTAPNTNITWLCPDLLGYSKRLSPSKSRLATFSFTDEFNNPIYFEGLDVVLTIMVYKDPTPWTLLENYIKYLMHKDMAAIRPGENSESAI